MFNERLQILVSRQQRRRLEAEARRRHESVSRVIRDAIDAQLGLASREARIRALKEIRAAEPGHFIEPQELDRLAEAEAEERLDRLGRPTRPE